MLIFLLLAVYVSCVAGRRAGAGALGLSISVKYVPLVLLPVLPRSGRGGSLRRAATSRRGWWRVGLALGLVAGGGDLTRCPIGRDRRPRRAALLAARAALNNSLLEGLVAAALAGAGRLRASLDGGAHPGGCPAQARRAVGLPRAVVGSSVARASWGLLVAWGWVLVWYALVASGWFWPWYVTWAVAWCRSGPMEHAQPGHAAPGGGPLTLYAFLPLHSSPIYGYRGVSGFCPRWSICCGRARAKALAGWRPAFGHSWRRALARPAAPDAGVRALRSSGHDPCEAVGVRSPAKEVKDGSSRSARQVGRCARKGQRATAMHHLGTWLQWHARRYERTRRATAAQGYVTHMSPAARPRRQRA